LERLDLWRGFSIYRFQINVIALNPNQQADSPTQRKVPNRTIAVLFGDENPDLKPSSNHTLHRPAIQHILAKYGTVFQGIGALKDHEIHLHQIPIDR
jgi:hypothetical protein